MPEERRILKKRRHVIFLIHGIRTQGEWATRAAAVLESDPTIRVRPIRYEFLDLIRFLVPLARFRNKAVHRVTRLIRDELSRDPDALSVIAHSFGSYIIGKILENEPDIEFHRVLLCGSILRDDFDWGRFGHRLYLESDDSWQVVNECGMQDIWPVMAKSLTWGYGSSGRFGFGNPRVKDRFYNVGHSGFFDEEFVRKRWLPYFVDGEIVQGVLDRATNPWWVSVLTVAKVRSIVLLLIFALSVWRTDAFWCEIYRNLFTSSSVSAPSTLESPRDLIEKRESRIISLKKEVIELTADFASIDDDSDKLVDKIRENAPKVAKMLEEASEENIGIGHKITKYEYIAYAFMLSASHEYSIADLTNYIEKGIAAGNHALILIDTLSSNDTVNEYHVDQITSWIIKERVNERVKYILAILYAIKAKNFSDDSLFSKIEELSNDISPIYREEYPFEKNSFLQWYQVKKQNNNNGGQIWPK